MDPLEIGNRNHTYKEIGEGRYVVAVSDNATVEAFIEQDVGATRNVFPGGELTWIQAHAKASIVFSSFFWTVEVITLLTSTSCAIDAEELFELVEEVGFWTEVREILTLRKRFRHGGLHRHPLEAVVAIALHHCRSDVLPSEDVLKSPLNSAGACT